MHDLRFALRMLAKTPGATLLSVVSLAIGIGVNSTLFTALDTAFLRPLQLARPEEIVRLDWPALPYSDYESLRRESRTVSDVVAVTSAGATLSIPGGTSVLTGEVVSPNYFSALGIRLAHGRGFLTAAAARGDNAAAVVISHALWVNRFASDPEIVGKPIELTQRAYTIIGVAAPGYTGTLRLRSADLWFAAGGEIARREKLFSIIGRARPGESVGSVRAEWESLLPRLVPNLKPSRPGNPLVSVFSEKEWKLDHGGRLAILLMPVISLVLLVACLNVASLSLARTEDRKHEYAVRLALGARRWHLLRQSMTESALVSFTSAIGALVLASWLLEVLPALVPATLFNLVPDLHLDARSIWHAGASAAVSTFLIGIAPAWRITRANLSRTLNHGDVPLGAALRWWSGRNLVVAGQLVIAIVLITTATMLVRGFFRARVQDMGFTRRNLLVVSILPELGGLRGEAIRGYAAQLKQRLNGSPGIATVSFAHHAPFSMSGGGYSVRASIPGDLDAPTAGRSIRATVVDPDYFKILGVRLLQGRVFNDGDQENSTPVLVISDAMARRFWPDADPVGRSIVLPDQGGRAFQVIGVVANISDSQVGRGLEPFLYLAFAQTSVRAPAILIHAKSGNPAQIIDEVRGVMRELDERVTPIGIETMNSLLRMAMLPEWLGCWFAGILGSLAVMLSIGGLYALVSYSVVRRTREFGIRMSLGAAPRDTMVQVFVHAMQLLAPGLVLGLPLAIGAGFVIRSLLHGVSPLDPLTLAAVSAAAIIVVLIASLAPARRAARINPIEALRSE